MPRVVRSITALLCLPLFAEQSQSVKDQLSHGGEILLHQELRITAAEHDWNIDAGRTTIQLAPDFQGRAAVVISGGHNIHIQGLNIDGNRTNLRSADQEVAPANVPLAEFTRYNGVLVEKSSGVQLENLAFRNVAGLAVLVSASDHVKVSGIHVTGGGSRNARHRNNNTGGIVVEEGTHDFEISNCDLRDVLGNGIWTRSRAKSPRNADGRIVNNKISGIGHDAVHIGFATRMLVEKNTGGKIGYPFDAVADEPELLPVALATSGNTDATQFRDNTFEEVNGRCIGLDGFHDGDVRGNSCINGFERAAYPNSDFGIAMNNTSPQTETRNVLIWGNRLEGFLYGGVLVIGSGHTISNNHFLNLNQAHCNERFRQTTCRYAEGEPDLLRSGIYLRSKGERAAITRDNTIENNEISGFGMGSKCVAIGPGVDAAQNRIDHNNCIDDAPASARLQPFSTAPAIITRAIAFTSLRTGGSSNVGNTSNSPSHQLE